MRTLPFLKHVKSVFCLNHNACTRCNLCCVVTNPPHSCGTSVIIYLPYFRSILLHITFNAFFEIQIRLHGESRSFQQFREQHHPTLFKQLAVVFLEVKRIFCTDKSEATSPITDRGRHRHFLTSICASPTSSARNRIHHIEGAMCISCLNTGALGNWPWVYFPPAIQI